MLLFLDQNFIQVLEGPTEAVERTFRTIQNDLSHRGVAILLRRSIVARDFKDWSMGFERLHHLDDKLLEGAFQVSAVICPLPSGPSTILVWTMKEQRNGQEAQAGGDYRQAA